MEDKDKKPVETENLEAIELEDEELEDVAGGSNSGCTINYCKPN